MLQGIRKNLKSAVSKLRAGFKASEAEAPRKLRSARGQAAIIIMLIVAIALIIYAVILNLSRVAQIKNTTMIAANTAAAMEGSLMASYGQSIIETSLDGGKDKCGWTGVFAAIISAIIIIIAIVLAYFTGGLSLTLIEVAILILALVLAIVIQIAVVQPGITALWNRIMEAQLVPLDQFVERGIQQVLSTVVTDPVMIGDIIDTDLDGRFGLDNEGNPVDRVSRFSLYYLKRLRAIRPRSGLLLDAFFDELREFLLVEAGDWGLWDPIPPDCVAGHTSCTDPVPTLFNECCVPNRDRPICCDCSLWGSGGTGWGGHPLYYGPCQIGYEFEGNIEPGETIEECGTVTTCGEVVRAPNEPSDPFMATDPSVYNYSLYYRGAHQDNEENGQWSLREFIGRDDENPYWEKSYDFNNSVSLYRQQINPRIPANPPPIPDGYRIQDTKGYYRPPVYTAGQLDSKPGLYSIFYKLKQWGVDLTQIDTTNEFRHCHWCDRANDPVCSAAGGSTGLQELDTGNNIMQLLQPPASTWPAPLGAFNLNGGWCVDNVNNPGPAAKPLILDMVGDVETFLTADDECAVNTDDAALNDDGINEKFFKTGADRWCSSDQYRWNHIIGDPIGPPLVNHHPNPFMSPVSAGSVVPYFGLCEKHRACPGEEADCYCGHPAVDTPSERLLFREDGIDQFIYGLTEFIQFADASLLAQQTIELDPLIWYPQAAEWFEPRNVGPLNYFKNGYLWVWYYTLDNWVNRFNRWINPSIAPERYPGSVTPSTGYASANPNDVWCYGDLTQFGPDTSTPEYMSVAEETAITSASPNDDLDRVLACLNWNANDTMATGNGAPWLSLFIGGGPIVGNARKFQVCSEPLWCGILWRSCEQMPRSLVPQTFFDQRAFIPVPQVTKDNADCLVGIPGGPAACTPGACNPVSQRLAGINWDPTWCNLGGPWCPGCGNIVFDNIFFEAINVAVVAVPEPTCININFTNLMQVSFAAATNQVTKIRKRIYFLENLRADIENRILPVITEARNQFENFLLGPDDTLCYLAGCGGPDSPVEFLMSEYINFRDEPSLPSQAIYAWQSEPTPRYPNGPWHIVRADVKIPLRCDNACGTSSPFTDPPWPDIRTYTKDLGTRRCYEINNTRGVVKVRVTRFDEDRPSNLLRFPFGQEIWRFRFFHPLAPRALNVNDRIESDCLRLYGPSTLGTYLFWDDTTTPIYPPPASHPVTRAFLLNDDDPTRPEWGVFPQCWDTVNELLESGVVSESCAEYYYKDGSLDPDHGASVTCNTIPTSPIPTTVCTSHGGINGFNLKFVDCRAGGRSFE